MAEAAVHTDSSGSNEQNGLRRRHPSTSSQHSSVGVPSRKGSFLQKHIAIGPDQAIHKAQDSLFSSSSGYTNYRGFVNLAVLLLVVSNGRVALENLIKYGVLVSPVQWIIFLCTDPWNWPNATLVVLANISVFVVFFMEKMLEKKWIGNSFACIVYVVLLTVHMGGPVLVTLALKGNPLYSAVALSIFVVTALKLISYAHVNYWCRTDRELRRITGGGNEKKIQRPYAVSYPNNLTVSNMYYFLFAPTLCYELNYPRTPKIRKSFILRRLGEMVGLTFLIIALNQQWVVPLLKNSLAPFSEMDVGRCLERLLKLAVPNHLIWLLFFYLLFHSTLNFLAELLRFGDRQFYKDWWNSETITHFWKSWNIPVHRWALRHIYLPMVRNHYNKLTAALAVFFISALLHEYLVSVPLHMFRLWAYYGMMAQVPLGLVTDYILRGGRAGNIVVWLSLILGQPMAILIMATDSGPLAGLRAYSIVHPSAGDLIVYWLQEEEILGVTDAHEVVYEKVLRRSDRSTLLGSIALSLVEPRWTTVMRDRQLEIARLTEHDITLKYVTLQRVTLQKLDAHEAKRKLKKLLFALVHELVSAKKEEVASKNSSPAKVSKPPTVIAKTANQSSFDATKRKRRMPGGAIFAD